MCPPFAHDDNNDTTIAGGTDGTIIGNEGDRLKVTSLVTSIAGGLVLTVSSKLRYDDMNATNGGVARGTNIVSGAAATTVYSYSGSGSFTGFLLNLSGASTSSHVWRINLVVDGEEIFNSSGISTPDLMDQAIYDFNTSGTREPSVLGIEMAGTTITFQTTPSFPMRYNSSVAIKVTKVSGGDRVFNAGLVMLTKET